jgi:branched-chain amino acid transport system ATP-binding protein
MLTLEDVHVHYGPIAALKGISMYIAEGEVVALVGPNGAGKSTTINSIIGIVRPSGGAIDFDGEPVIGVAPERLVGRGIGLVPEGRRIFGTLTVAENLRLGATSRADKSTVDEEIERVLTRFPILENYYKSHADRLSGGEQQQLAIARALLSKPRLLLLDEPSFGLAPKVVAGIFEILRAINREEGVAILLVEQNAAMALDFAEHAFLLETGRIAMRGPARELREDDAVRRAYLGY